MCLTTEWCSLVWVPNVTDLWPLVDAGYAQILKTLICQAQRRWLDDDNNTEKWYGHDSSFTSKERRILITHWIGEAYEKLTSAEYDHLGLRVWQKTGCLITADGSDDQLIKPEGLKNYEVSPPAYFPPTACLPQIEENPVPGAEHMVSEEEADQRILVKSCPIQTWQRSKKIGLKIKITAMVLLGGKSLPSMKMAGSQAQLCISTKS